MCGIVGYVGHRPALDVVLQGLGRLEYRGYDSAGVAVLDGAGGLAVGRKAGPLVNLVSRLDAAGRDAFGGTAGMGHTRWATHGAPTDRNAHPHLDSTARLAVVHNGIIENFVQLRTELEAAGVELSSDTDTEAAAHLIAAQYTCCGNLADAVRAVCRRLEGAFTLVVTHADEPDLVVAARRSSPLVVGVGKGEHFVASDVAAFIEHTREAVELGQDQVVTIIWEGYEVTDFAGADTATRFFHVDWDLSAAEKGGHDYFMLKEIQEQPGAVADTLRERRSPAANRGSPLTVVAPAPRPGHELIWRVQRDHSRARRPELRGARSTSPKVRRPCHVGRPHVPASQGPSLHSGSPRSPMPYRCGSGDRLRPVRRGS